MRVQIRKATLADAQYIGRNLRKIDQKEAYYATGIRPLKATLKSLEVSAKTWAATPKHQIHPIALFGVQGVKGDIGFPWMVGTNELSKFRKELLTISKYWADHIHSQFPFLLNFCLPENVKSIRWLKRLGFKFEAKTRPYGPFNWPFVMFWRI